MRWRRKKTDEQWARIEAGSRGVQDELARIEAEAQHEELNRIQARLEEPVSKEEAAMLVDRLVGMGPVRGSFGDWDRSRGRCHHMGPYPGCTGGCNR
jgi:hypothetical protein